MLPLRVAVEPPEDLRWTSTTTTTKRITTITATRTKTPRRTSSPPQLASNNPSPPVRRFSSTTQQGTLHPPSPSPPSPSRSTSPPKGITEQERLVEEGGTTSGEGSSRSRKRGTSSLEDRRCLFFLEERVGDVGRTRTHHYLLGRFALFVLPLSRSLLFYRAFLSLLFDLFLARHVLQRPSLPFLRFLFNLSFDSSISLSYHDMTLIPCLP